MTPKTIFLRVARSIGLFWLMRRSAWRRARLLILCYHGVSMIDEHEWNSELYITQERLRERLQRLKEGGYTILPLTDALKKLQAGALPPRAIALTFDDGPCDFAERAVPVLREFNAPATVYLTTYYCEHRFPVFDPALAYVLWRGRNSGCDLADLWDDSGPMTIDMPLERAATWRKITDYVRRRKVGAEEKQDLLAKICARIGIDFDSFLNFRILQIMTPQQVRDLPRELIDVQLHTHRHRTPRVEGAFVRELQDNQASIAKMTGVATQRTHFCYPSGDYSLEFPDWLRQEGIESATTCVPGLASRDDDLFLLPRFVDSMTASNLSFDAWISGFADILPRRAIHRLNPERD